MNSTISEIRMGKGLTRREVAGAMGLSNREYELYELGLVDIPKGIEVRIRKYLSQFGAL
jgi:transcriptional regulator with XRE-family HTH domain